MSSSFHKKNHNSKAEHGTMQSYVVGFILSLIFTFIPYYLVVNHTVKGTALLVTILGFAMVQMLIQITFFLHIGRGPKPRWNLVFFVSTFGIILMVVCGSVIIINNLHYNMAPSDQVKRLIGDEGIAQIGGVETGACQEIHDNHIVVIENGQNTNLRTYAYKCDTLTFVNNDDEVREIAFGVHPNHDVYAGSTELIVSKGQSKTITLSEPGTYEFHDHLHEEITGVFIVSTR